MLIRDKKTTILLTGASGFIGKYFLDLVKDKYSVIAIARRSGTEAGIPFHPNIRWIQWNISNKLAYSEVMGYLIGSGGADIVIHLAGYYDYEYNENPEYQKTNINGTRNVLELSRYLDVKHFIFASSLAACKFPKNGSVIDENSPADAGFAYARSKKAGEELCAEYSKYFKCSVVRFAAVYSDWCEYAPLYQFLQTWLSGKWDSRILAGKGRSAITYIHIHDLALLFIRLIKKTGELPQFGTYIASPDGSTCHRELFTVATRDYYGKPLKPVFIPKVLTYPGIFAKKLLGKLRLVSEPFEKLWMLRYIDLCLEADSSNTRRILDWFPIQRYHILRRMIILLDKMKSHPNEWKIKNEAAVKRETYRSNLIIYEILVEEQQNLENRILSEILDPAGALMFKNYRKMNLKDLQVAISIMYHLLLASIRSADRTIMLKYLEEIALQRFAEGFEPAEINRVLDIFDINLRGHLESRPELGKNMKQDIYDFVGLSVQLARDQIEDVYDSLEMKFPGEKIALLRKLADEEKKHEEIRQLSAFYQEYQEEADAKTD